MTKIFLAALMLLTWTAVLNAAEEPKEKQNLVFPEYFSDFLLKDQFSLKIMEVTKQEHIEVSANEYPGLEMDLPALKERLQVPKPKFLTPPRTPEYFQGGQILSYWGFPMDSGQLGSLPVVEE